MAYESITFITGNSGKRDQVKRYLNFQFETLDLDLPEIQSLDLHEIVENKARAAYKMVQKAVLVEDTSLVFDSMGALPGPLIKWFLKEIGNDGLIKLSSLNKSKKATAHIAFGLFDGVELHFFDGKLKGSISKTARGKNSFGWDPIFIPDGYKKTLAEMTKEELDEVSPRKKALKKMEGFIS